MCRTSLVSPEHPVLWIPVRPTNSIFDPSLARKQCNTIEIRPRAARWVKHLDFTKQKLLRQSYLGAAKRPACLENAQEQRTCLLCPPTQLQVLPETLDAVAHLNQLDDSTLENSNNSSAVTTHRTP